MDCSCIRGSGTKFDFYLELLDCDTLVFTDLSNWMEEDYYVVPDEWTMTIKFPSGTTKDIKFKPKGTTIITASDLGIPCILDGIYCFSTFSCGNTYYRNEALLCSLECKLDTLIHQLDISLYNYDKNLAFAQKISVYINSIKTNARIGKTQLANKYFDITSRELEKVECI